jgi:hypothetical protein
MQAFRFATKVTAARALAKRHAPKVHAAIDKAGDVAKSRLPAEHHDKVDTGARMAKKAATGTDRPAGGGSGRRS